MQKNRAPGALFPTQIRNFAAFGPADLVADQRPSAHELMLLHTSPGAAIATASNRLELYCAARPPCVTRHVTQPVRACFASISCHSCSLFTSFLSFCWCASCSCLLCLRLRLVFMPGASPDWMAGGGGAVQTSANNGDGGFVELRALCCYSNGAYSQALGMLASPSTSRAASSPCEMADLPIVAL